MARFLRTQKENIGLSPDTFLLKGRKKTDNVLVRYITYNSTDLLECELTDIMSQEEMEIEPNTAWLNIDGLHDLEVMNTISKKFDLDQLILADVMNTDARPKIYEYDNCIYISLKMLGYDDDLDNVEAENITFIIKEHILITFQEKKGDYFEPVRERIRKSRKRIRSSSTDYLAFALIDIVIDHYSYVISRIGEHIESIDEKLLHDPQSDLLEEINNYKSEIIYLRKAIKPCCELISTFSKLDSELIADATFVHLNELHSNINQASDSLDSYREILTDQLNIYHTIVSSKLNDVMKFLTVFSVVFIPLTFIAGIYGTNFDNVPELHYRYSYFIMWGVMILVSVLMLLYFRRRKWL